MAAGDNKAVVDPFASLGFVEEKAPTADFGALGFQPEAPAAASQADVRKTEPKLSPMKAFEERTRAFEDARKRWRAETGGALQPGQTENQAVAAWASTTDPESDRAMAEIEELAQGGELQYGGSVPYGAAKTLASIGGFAVGGPLTATAAESAVRAVALFSGLQKALDAGAIDYDRAERIALRELSSGAAGDLAWNVGIPLLAQVIAKVPGVRGLVARVASKLKGAPVSPTADLVEQQATKTAKRVADAKTPAAKAAVQELSDRIGGHVLTPGQVTGKASLAEQTARISGEAKFAAQHEAVQKAAEAMREGVVAPAGQPTREMIGDTIQTLAEKTQKAMKDRLRPVFKAADASGVQVDFSPVLARAQAALAADAAIPGGRLASAERAALAGLVDDLSKLASPAVPAGAGKPAGAVATGLLDASGAPIMKATPAVPGTPARPAVPPIVNAEQALDFISRQKEKLRLTTADWKPSAFYETIMNGLQRDADKAFVAAAEKSGGAAGADLVSMLKSAQSQYRDVMTTVYDDAVKQALKRNPEDVGRLFWQRGNVSEPKQLQRLLALAQREGTASAKGAMDLNRSMARGFLQEAVPNTEAAAKWSQMLREKPALRDTWNTLTSAPGGKELRAAMDVLEEAAKIAQRGDKELVGQLGVAAMPFRRAAHGLLGFSYVTGAINLPFLGVGLTIDGLTRLMATAYVQGNKGVLNATMRALRASGAGTAASAKVLQATMPEIEKFAAEHGITGLVVRGDEGQPSEPEPQ